jgi:predicted RNA methylase
VRVSNDVLNVLAACDFDGPCLVLTGQLDRKLYTATNAVLEAAGGKWDKKAKAHVFPVDASDAMEQIIQTGEVTLIRTIQQDFGYFPTPSDVVDRLIELADIEPAMLALEPSAGQGNIVAAMERAGARVDAVELLLPNVVALSKQGLARSIVNADFLTMQPAAIYDRVVMNPPFAKQADIKHVLHALKFLKPDGLLVSVMSAGVTFRDDKLTRGFCDLIRSRGGDIEALDDGAFKASGTMVRTVIVRISGDAT